MSAIGLLVIPEEDAAQFSPGMPGHDLVFALQAAIREAMRATGMPCTVAQMALRVAMQNLDIAAPFVDAALDGISPP